MKKKKRPLRGTAVNRALYSAPKIEVQAVALEYGIAAGSAIVRPPDEVGEIKTEWEVGRDREANLDW